MKVVAVIPALNEEGSIGRVVAAVPRDLVAEVVVVNNGSTDRTAEVASAAGARIVTERERGYGAACRAGLDAAADADILVYLDGDASDQPEELANILGPVVRGQADLVIGSRLMGRREAGAMPPHAVFGNWLTARLVRLLYGVRITDLGSFRAIRRADLVALDMRERTYGWPVEMIVKAARRGYRIREVPVTHRKRIGKSKVAGTLMGSLKAAYFILVTTFRYAFRN
ncbi:MAG: glycosyltransferase family 2 protein [candidate division NC10 bacterium]|nr:glycosyltransferase family 2 protein [candidate division NC10 bacterium]MBI2114792.1 glycosyltransferase family 2 protein [candidate division NC10 bacterium]MBI2916648.1 glycosyltransferase family 2 protein [Chloroflexota bacterium]MBI3084528.1 glycosyltransferase family 2 protein [candidate division NC10 bacterium]MBI3122083.1 glycosyltransferase family 2 protein [candidate division NC10 bacterium]